MTSKSNYFFSNSFFHATLFLNFNFFKIELFFFSNSFFSCNSFFSKIYPPSKSNSFFNSFFLTLFLYHVIGEVVWGEVSWSLVCGHVTERGKKKVFETINTILLLLGIQMSRPLSFVYIWEVNILILTSEL